MTDHTLVPFGLDVMTDELVDVQGVSRGSACACVCPSCRTPLIARQGAIKIWHFAHESRGTAEETKELCEYSLWVSIKLMARQLFMQATTVALPVHSLHRQTGTWVAAQQVSTERRVTLTSVSVETPLQGVLVDAIGTVPGRKTTASFKIGFCFSYPGRETSLMDVSPLANSKVGLVEIDLTGVNTLFLQVHGRSDGRGYKEILRSFLFESASSKRWLYHPKLSRIETKLDKASAEMLNRSVGDSGIARWNRSAGEVCWYGCRRCLVKWAGLRAPRTYCLTCRRDDRIALIGAAASSDLGLAPVSW